MAGPNLAKIESQTLLNQFVRFIALKSEAVSRFFPKYNYRIQKYLATLVHLAAVLYLYARVDAIYPSRILVMTPYIHEQ